MVTSLSELCAHLDVVASLIVQPDRRQTADRRRTRRGGRRADDINPGADALDMRAVAMRRAVGGSNVSSTRPADDHDQHKSRYARATRAVSSTVRLTGSAVGRRILE
jgi:hypothetical protein